MLSDVSPYWFLSPPEAYRISRGGVDAMIEAESHDSFTFARFLALLINSGLQLSPPLDEEELSTSAAMLVAELDTVSLPVDDVDCLLDTLSESTTPISVLQILLEASGETLPRMVALLLAERGCFDDRIRSLLEAVRSDDGLSSESTARASLYLALHSNSVEGLVSFAKEMGSPTDEISATIAALAAFAMADREKLSRLVYNYSQYSDLQTVSILAGVLTIPMPDSISAPFPEFEDLNLCNFLDLLPEIIEAVNGSFSRVIQLPSREVAFYALQWLSARKRIDNAFVCLKTNRILVN